MDGILSGLFSRKKDSAARDSDKSPDIDELLGYEGDPFNATHLIPADSADSTITPSSADTKSSILPTSSNKRSAAMRLTKSDPIPDFDKDAISDFGFAPEAEINSNRVREVQRPTNLPSAVIGPKISFKGELSGEEDLLIQGRVEGTIDLKGNHLVIGSQGVIKANVSARTITVEGSVEGDIFATEHIAIKSASQVRGNLKAERVTLEDGAKFRGSIEMDMESEKRDEPKPEFKKTTPVIAPASAYMPENNDIK